MLKYSGDFAHITPVVIFYFVLLQAFTGLKSILLGISYAVWTVIGSTGAVVVEVMFFDDLVNFGRLFSIVLVVLSILDLKMFTK